MVYRMHDAQHGHHPDAIGVKIVVVLNSVARFYLRQPECHRLRLRSLLLSTKSNSIAPRVFLLQPNRNRRSRWLLITNFCDAVCHHHSFLSRCNRESLVRKSRDEDSSRIRNCSKCCDSTLLVTPFRSRTGNHPESSVTNHLFRIGVSMILFH